MESYKHYPYKFDITAIEGKNLSPIQMPVIMSFTRDGTFGIFESIRIIKGKPYKFIKRRDNRQKLYEKRRRHGRKI